MAILFTLIKCFISNNILRITILNKKYINSFFLFVLILILNGSNFGENIRSFAVIIDQQTYNKTQDAVKAYAEALNKDGLKTELIVNDWKNPDQVKAEIIKLYNSGVNLEGVVFVGDIPIPMIRNAQHLTSAFKMDEDKYDRFKSSIPSDRFYDDFDLQFEFQGQDSNHTLCFYYTLTSESPQKVEREIYSGRIKAPVSDESKYQMISKYLYKAAKTKSEKNKIDNAFVFTGHGYYSESLTAWTDEHVSLREQFPQLFIPGGNLDFLNFNMSREMKEILMIELEQKNLDIAIFHAHGHPEIQYILDYPKAQSIQSNVEEIKRFLRSKVRGAQRRKQDVEQAKNYYKENYNVPDIWMADALSDSSIKADSIYNHSLDIYSEDLDLFSPQAKVVMFDECFNGSFHQENYIAGKYIFGDGNTIVGIANSVNSLQDKWANEFLGLLNYGVRLGNWHKFTNYLESHIIGDPTFKFENIYDADVDNALTDKKDNSNTWNKFLNSSSVPLKCLAIRKLSKLNGQAFSKSLVNYLKTDPSFLVRLEALTRLAELNNDDFREVLLTSVTDPYELIRRKSVELMGKIGKDEYIPIILKTVINDPSNRVSFNGRNALSVMNHDKTIESAKQIVNSMPSFVSKQLLIDNLTGSFERNKNWLYDDILKSILNDSLSLKKRISAVRTLRNYNFIDAVPRLIDILKMENIDAAIKVNIVEALGWFNFFYNKDFIINELEKLLTGNNCTSEMKDEIVQTNSRLIQGANVPITP